MVAWAFGAGGIYTATWDGASTVTVTLTSGGMFLGSFAPVATLGAAQAAVATFTPAPVGVGNLLLDAAAADITQVGIAALPGATGKAADAGHGHADVNAHPADFGWIAWTADPANAANNTGALTSGTVYLAEFFLRAAATLHNVLLNVVTAGITLTAAESFAGVYDSGGTLRAITADQSGNWIATGAQTIPFTSAYPAAAGRYYIAIVSVGTTPPAFRASTTAPQMANTGLAAASLRFAVAATGQTTLPGSVTPSSFTSPTAVAHCAAVS